MSSPARRPALADQPAPERSWPRPAPPLMAALVAWGVLGLAASLDLVPAAAWGAAGVALAALAALDAWRIARDCWRNDAHPASARSRGFKRTPFGGGRYGRRVKVPRAESSAMAPGASAGRGYSRSRTARNTATAGRSNSGKASTILSPPPSDTYDATRDP